MRSDSYIVPLAPFRRSLADSSDGAHSTALTKRLLQSLASEEGATPTQRVVVSSADFVGGTDRPKSRTTSLMVPPPALLLGLAPPDHVHQQHRRAMSAAPMLTAVRLAVTPSAWVRTVTDEKRQVAYVFRARRPWLGVAIVAFGSFLTGLVSSGVGESCAVVLFVTSGFPLEVASGTSVSVTFAVVASASIAQIVIQGVGSVPWNLLCWSAPGVLIGGQIGARLSSKVAPKAVFGVLFVTLLILATVMAVEALVSFSVISE